MDNFTLLNGTIILCAKRRSGKSTLLKHLVVCEQDEFDKIFVICPTEQVNKFYSSIVPENCIQDTYDEQWI